MTMKNRVHRARALRYVAYLAAIGTVFSLSACDSAPGIARVAAYPDKGKQLQSPSPLWDYQNKINPATNIRTSGPYDWEDLYRGPNGFPLPGAAQIR